MSTVMEEEFKRWTAKRKAALVTEIIQGKTSVAEASRTYDMPPSEIEEWVEEGRKGLENGGCPRFCVIGKLFNAAAYAHRT